MEFGHATILLISVFVLPYLLWEAFKNRHKFLFRKNKNKK